MSEIPAELRRPAMIEAKGYADQRYADILIVILEDGSQRIFPNDLTGLDNAKSLLHWATMAFERLHAEEDAHL